MVCKMIGGNDFLFLSQLLLQLLLMTSYSHIGHIVKKKRKPTSLLIHGFVHILGGILSIHEVPFHSQNGILQSSLSSFTEIAIVQRAEHKTQNYNRRYKEHSGG